MVNTRPPRSRPKAPPRPKSTELFAVVTGSVLSGFEFWGPFNSVDESVEWIESCPLIGHVTVVPIKSTEEYR